MNHGTAHNSMPSAFFVYTKQGLPLNVLPQPSTSKLLTIPYGSKVIYTGNQYLDTNDETWLQVTFGIYKGFIQPSFITPFPLPTSTETIEDYYKRLVNMNFDVKYESWELEDRTEFKILLPTSNIYQAYLVAQALYPMYDFKIPACRYKQKEILVHQTPQEDLIEEIAIFRDSDGDLIHVEYIADFGDSSDIIKISPHIDDTLLSFGTYTIKDEALVTDKLPSNF